MGGVETAVEELCNHYESLGIETCVLTKQYPYELPENGKDGNTDIVRIKRPITNEEYLNTLKKIISNPLLKADIIHVMGVRRPLPLFALYLARYYDIPIIMNFVGSDVLTSRNPEDLKIWEECKIDTINSIQQADGFISFSQGITDAARKLLPNLGEITTVYSGIDLKRIHKPNAKKHLGRYIIAARRLIYNKGIDILLKAFKIVQDAIPTISLYIIGDGPEKENLLKLVGNLNLRNVHFTGTIPLEELFSYMKAAEVHVCPSRAEGGGIVNVEASACGCIPIGSNVDGIPEYIQDNISGLLFQSESYEQLASKILDILNNPDKKAQMQEKGYQFSNEFDINVKAKEYLDVYNKVQTSLIKPWSETSQQMLRIIEDEKRN